MDEFEAVKAILLEKLNCTDRHLIAITSESRGKWKDALEAYESMFQSDPNEFRYGKELLYESYFNCFTHLSEWKELSENIGRAAPSEGESLWGALWDQDWNQKKLLPWYIKAELRKILCDKTAAEQLVSRINECFRDTEKFEYLKANFSEELAMLRLLNGDLNEAKQHSQTCISLFLENWCSLNPLFNKLRFNRILSVRNAVDIDVFVKECGSLVASNFEATVDYLLKFWEQAMKETVPNLALFETRMLYHKEFVTVFDEKLKSVVAFEEELQNSIVLLDDVKFNMNFSVICAALKHANFYVARKYYLQQKSADIGSKDKLQLNLAISRIGLLKAQSSEGQAKLKCLLESLQPLGKCQNYH